MPKVELCGTIGKCQDYMENAYSIGHEVTIVIAPIKLRVLNSEDIHGEDIRIVNNCNKSECANPSCWYSSVSRKKRRDQIDTSAVKP